MANYEKMYDLFDLALWMQETSEGLSLEDIEQKYNVSRRTAERMRNALMTYFPQMEEVADEAKNFIFHPKQKLIKNPDGTLTVKFKAGGRREMDWHLYTWGDKVKVIKPKDFDQRKVWKD